MFVSNPVFPISFKLEQVAKLIEETLHKKHWKSFEAGEIKLVLLPLYLFYYDAALGEKGKTERGMLTLNGETAELSKSLTESLPDESSLGKEVPDEYPLVVRKPIFSKPEAEKIALLKTASMLGLERQGIVLSGFKMVYYPMWLAFVTVSGENYRLEISGVTGELFGSEKVPEREKGFVEITRETLDELKQPKAWLKYSREIMEIGTAAVAGKGMHRTGPSFWHRYGFWLIVLLIIILLIAVLYL